jgi:hypothetical protein
MRLGGREVLVAAVFSWHSRKFQPVAFERIYRVDSIRRFGMSGVSHATTNGGAWDGRRKADERETRREGEARPERPARPGMEEEEEEEEEEEDGDT